MPENPDTLAHGHAAFMMKAARPVSLWHKKNGTCKSRVPSFAFVRQTLFHEDQLSNQGASIDFQMIEIDAAREIAGAVG